MENNEKVCCENHCGCGHHAIMPIAIALIGASFLLTTFGVITEQVNSIVWPILLIIAVGAKYMKGCKCCGSKCGSDGKCS